MIDEIKVSASTCNDEKYYYGIFKPKPLNFTETYLIMLFFLNIPFFLICLFAFWLALLSKGPRDKVYISVLRSACVNLSAGPQGTLPACIIGYKGTLDIFPF